MTLASLHRRIVRCTQCPRLVKWREEVARAQLQRDGISVTARFHVSQQNTQTGRLTEAMFAQVLNGLRSLLDAPDASRG